MTVNFNKARQKDKPRIEITRRDINLFNFLFDNKIATSAQIARNIFNSCSQARLYRRLAILKKAKYLNVSSVAITSRGKSAYSLTPKSFEVMRNSVNREVCRNQIASDSKEHDIVLLDILDKLSKITGFQEIVTENALLSYRDCIDDSYLGVYSRLESDAFMRLRRAQDNLDFAVEYERSSKNARDLSQKFIDYRFSPEIANVLYIAENNNILKRLLSICAPVEISTDEKFLFTTVDNVFSHRGFLQVRTCSGAIKKLEICAG